MTIFGKNGLGNILKIILQIGIVIGIIFLILLYPLIKYLNLHFDYFIMMIYPIGIVTLYLVYQFTRLFGSLKLNKPFCFETVNYLRKAMSASFLISFLIIISLLINIFLYNYYSLQFQVALGLISILFFGVGIALYILADLFKTATIYKEENDLTI